ncbi:MAG: hypothetical protein U0414_32545 [Polyangiaceae bacterium]
MKPSPAPRALGPMLLGSALALGCSETTTQSNEHHPRGATPSAAELEARAAARFGLETRADRTFEDAPAPARAKRPGPAGTPIEDAIPASSNGPGDVAPGCQCTVSAATLDVSIPCGQSACVNDRRYDCVAADQTVEADSCGTPSSCRCTVDSDGGGPKGFTRECDTTICFEGRLARCTPQREVVRGERCGT